MGCRCTNGTNYQLEVLVCATGFDTSFRPRFSITTDDSDLQHTWRDEPESYLGIAAAGFPNMFFFLGPQSPVGNGNTLAAIGQQA